MAHRLDFDLPVHGAANGDEDGPHCGPTAYVSNEEAAIFVQLRELKSEADRVRARVCDTSPESEQAEAERRLGELRSRWSELVDRREQAFRRKMIMLGHLPPDDDVKLY